MLPNTGIFSSGRSPLLVTFILSLFFTGALIASAQMPGQKVPGPPPAQVKQVSHGIRAIVGSEVIEITVCTDSVIHVVAIPEPSVPATPRPWMLDAQQSCPGAPFAFTQDAKTPSMKTAQVE